MEKAQKTVGLSSDSHIVKKLSKTIQKYEKFCRNYTEYTRFKKRQKDEKSSEEGFQREQGDLRFTYDFVKDKLINEVQNIEIEIMRDLKFDIDQLEDDLNDYDDFKELCMDVLDKIEAEVFENSSAHSTESIKEMGLLDQF